MHLKFLNRGTGSASAAKEYLLQERDHQGEVRADIQVLRGNPNFVTELADSLDFKHRYTSGVIAWHKDDAPTDEQINQVLDDFERVAFAGLEANQYSYYAVLHEESNGSKHIHIVAPRVELTTGKSMNIAPPNWQKTYDVLVDKYNTKYDWASPKDLHRRKLVNNQIQLHSNMTHTKAKVEINKAVMELVGNGVIKNEDTLIDYLNSIDGVIVKPRRSKKTLSILLEGIKKPIRLEGLAYAKGFDTRELRQEFRAEQEKRAEKSTADRARDHERVSAVLESIISDRAKFNQGRYKRVSRVHSGDEDRNIREPNRHQTSEQQFHKTNEQVKRDRPKEHRGGTGENLYEHEQRERRISPINGERERRTSPSNGKNKERTNREGRILSKEHTHIRSDWIYINRDDGRIHNIRRIEENDRIRERIKRNSEATARDIQRRAREDSKRIREENEKRDRGATEELHKQLREVTEELHKRFKKYTAGIRSKYIIHDKALQQTSNTNDGTSGQARRNNQELRRRVSRDKDKFRLQASGELEGAVNKLRETLVLSGIAIRKYGKQIIEKVQKVISHRAQQRERVYTRPSPRRMMSP